MKHRKITINLLLTIILIFLIPISAYAQDDNEMYSFGHFYYHSHEGYVSICGYLGRESDIEIPSSIAGKPVSEVESGTFNGCNTIKTITVPDTVVMVYDDSFTGAASLEKIISYTAGVEIKAGSGVTVEYKNDQNDSGNDAGNDSGNDAGDDANKDDSGKDSGKDSGNESDKNDSGNTDSGKGDSDKTDSNKTDSGKDNSDTTSSIGDFSFEESDDNSFNNGGIKINNSDFIVSVDDNKHLVQIDSDGNTVILDDSKEYSMEEQSDGNFIISDEEGNNINVNVTDEGNISFEKVKPDNQASEQSLVDEDGQDNIDNKENKGNSFILFALAAVGILAVIGGALFVLKKKK